MQEFNLIAILTDFGVEVLAVAAAAMLIVLVCKKSFNIDDKTVPILSFVIAFFVCFLLELTLFVPENDYALEKSAASGVIAALSASAFIKLAAGEKEDWENALNKVLSELCDGADLKEIVSDLTKKIKEEKLTDRESVEKLIKESLAPKVSESNLQLIIEFMLKTLHIDDRK